MKWGCLLCIFSLTFLLFYLFTKHNVSWDIFITRDIFRAQGWLNGQFYWPGPEMSGGQNLPGPLFYFLLFPPLLFGGNIYSQSLLWYISWLALSYTLAFSFVRKIIKHKESLLIFLIAFITTIGPGFFIPLGFAWNSGFSILFHILALMGLYYWRETNKNFYLYLVGLIIALGIQVHFLVSVHIITVFSFCLFDKKKKFLPLFLFLFLASFSSLSYFVMNHFDTFETSNLHSTEHLTYLKSQIFSEKWFRNLKKTLNFSYIVPFAFVFFAIFWAQWKIKKQALLQSTKNLIVITTIPCLIGIIISGKFWYIYFIPVFVILLLSKWCDDLMPNYRNKKLNYLLVCGLVFICPFLLFFNATALLSFNRFFYVVGSYYIPLLIVMFLIFSLIFIQITNSEWTYKDFGKVTVFFVFLLTLGQMKIIKGVAPYNTPPPIKASLSWLRYQQIYPLMNRILLDTNWPPKKAIKRIYTIGVLLEVSLLSHYSMARETMMKKKDHNGFLKDNDIYLDLKQSLEKPDGYMIIQHLKKFTNYSKKDWEQHLSDSSLLSDFLQKEIVEKKIVIKTPTQYDSYWLIPYKTTKNSVFVEGFYNIGQPYYWEEPVWLKSCSSTQQFKNKNGFYYCMVLPGHLQRAGVHIKKIDENIQGDTFPSSALEISFFGPLIGGGHCCSNLDGVALWSDIQIHVLCNKTYYKHDIPDIGNNWRSVEKNPESVVYWLTAPLKIRIPVRRFTVPPPNFSKCKKEHIKKIEMEFTHLHESIWMEKSDEKKVKIVWEK